MIRRRHALALLGSAALAAPAVHAQSLLDVRFTLDWALQGPQGAFLLALDRGYFREAGLNVTMDRGFGSGDVPVKISAGAYDVGVADLNPTIRMRLERPDSDLFTPFIIHDATAMAIMTLRRENIRTPADLVGKTLASPESDAGRQLFPAFAKAAGIDPNSVRWTTVTPQLREPMLVQGRATAITGVITSGIFSLRSLGIPALVRAQYDSLRDPAATIANLLRREPLTDVPLETERLRMALDRLTFTDHVRRNGFGQVDVPRLQRSIDAVREAFNISRPMPASDIYDPSYLPPATDLRQA